MLRSGIVTSIKNLPTLLNVSRFYVVYPVFFTPTDPRIWVF